MNVRRPRVVIFAAKGRDSIPAELQQPLDAIAAVEYIANLTPVTDARLAALCEGVEFVGLTRRTCRNLHEGLVASMPALRGVSVYATGTEWIDLTALRERRIALRHLADYSAQTVAEHGIAMLLALSRRLHLSDRMALGEIAATTSMRGWELQGKRIGVIGMGRIGSRIAKLADAFGMQVRYCDPHVNSHFPQADIDTLLRESDVIMLAASVNRERPVIIGATELARMRPQTYIVNPSRPDLVDNPSLLAAVRSGHIAGYAVDERVFGAADIDDIERGRIVQTCHTGWYSNEAMARGTAAWIENLIGLIRND